MPSMSPMFSRGDGAGFARPKRPGTAPSTLSRSASAPSSPAGVRHGRGGASPNFKRPASRGSATTCSPASGLARGAADSRPSTAPTGEHARYNTFFGRPTTAPHTPGPRSRSEAASAPGTPSRPQTAGSAPGKSPARAQSGTGRFSREELNCFRRVPSASEACTGDAVQQYLQGIGAERAEAAKANWHYLPVGKGKFWYPERKLQRAEARQELIRSRNKKEDDQPDVLPREEKTREVLDGIWPRSAAALPEPTLDETDTANETTLLEACLAPSPKSSAATPSHASGALARTPKANMAASFGALTLDASHASAPQLDRSRTLVEPGSPKLDRSKSHVALDSPKAGMLDRSRTLVALDSPKGGRPATAASHMRPGSPIARTLSGMGQRGRRKKKDMSHLEYKNMVENPRPLRHFRRWVFENYPSVKHCMDAMAKSVPCAILKLDWKRVLEKRGYPSGVDTPGDEMLSTLDFSGGRRVGLRDFHLSVEMAIPIVSMEDLRRRWIACGFRSMTEAIEMMNMERIEGTQRLTFQEFALLLERVFVTETEEQMTVFGLVSSDVGVVDWRDRTTSIGEFITGLATVSPPMILEDLRANLMVQHKGDLCKAFDVMDDDESGWLSHEELTVEARRLFGFTLEQADKAFREIDVDGSGEITRGEFVASLDLSEPALHLEDLRLKIRMRYRSLQEMFSTGFKDCVPEGQESDITFNSEKFVQVLKPLGLKPNEVVMLFNLCDCDHVGEICVPEFAKGVRRFAPGAVVEDFRVRCIQMKNDILPVFHDVLEKRFDILEMEAFRELLDGLKLLDPRDSEHLVQEVFDLIDVQHVGRVTLGRLLAALRSCGAGNKSPIPVPELEDRAKKDIKTDVSRVMKHILDAKVQTRYPLHTTVDLERLNMMRRRAQSSQGSRPGTASMSRTRGTASGIFAETVDEDEPPPGNVEEKGAPRLSVVKYEDLPDYVRAQQQSVDKRKPSEGAVNGMQQSWEYVFQQLNSTAAHLAPRKGLETSCHSYFQEAALAFSTDVPLLRKNQYRSTDIRKDFKRGSKAAKKRAAS